jgi:hypothetical protein
MRNPNDDDVPGWTGTRRGGRRIVTVEAIAS